MFSASFAQRGLGDLGDLLATRAVETARVGPWTTGNFTALAEAGVLAGFVDAEYGGTAASEAVLQNTLAAIAERCLTTALALSQWAAACRIIAAADTPIRRHWLPSLARGERLVTVGISQLTTSRQHVGAAALTAACDAAGWRLDGICPWVTGADTVDSIVTGAAADAGQMFFVVDSRADGVVVEPPLDMLALSGSRTSVVRLNGVRPAEVIAPTSAAGPRTGGLTTSALAIGATRACLTILDREARARPDLEPIVGQLRAETDALMDTLLAAATQGIDAAERDRLRAAANSLVVRASQAALTASKGAGFVAGHPVERLVREAMFFLVWSCPQTVTHAVMCELSSRETSASCRFSLGGPPPAGAHPGLRP